MIAFCRLNDGRCSDVGKQKGSGEYQIQTLPINSGTFSLIKDRFQDVVWIGTDGQGVYLYSNPLYSIKSVVLNNYTEKIERPVRALLLDKERTFGSVPKGMVYLKSLIMRYKRISRTVARRY